MKNRISGKVLLGALAAVILIAAFAVQFFGGGLPDPSAGDASERIAAIREIAAEGSIDASRAIARVAVKDRAPTVRCAAMLSLRKYVSPENRIAVEQGTGDDAPKVRAAAAMTLGKYADDAAVERLGDMLKTDKDDNVRLAAARGLARCNSRKGKDMLVSAMKANSSQAVRKRALTLLLEGSGVSLTPDPDPRNEGAWAWQMERVMRHVNATGANAPRTRVRDRKGR